MGQRQQKIKFQIISFKDHYHQNIQWIEPGKFRPTEMILEYCGWVTFENDELVILSQGRGSSDGDYDSHMHILKNCITKRKTIQIG